MQTDQKAREVGFVYKDERRLVGCSPDGLVGDDALLELKVPKAATHMVWLIEDELPREHFCQCQFALWVTGMKRLWWMSYHPQLPEVLHEVGPDSTYQKALERSHARVYQRVGRGPQEGCQHGRDA